MVHYITLTQIFTLKIDLANAQYTEIHVLDKNRKILLKIILIHEISRSSFINAQPEIHIWNRL